MSSQQFQENRLIGFVYGLLPLVIAGGVLFLLVTIAGRAVQGYEARKEYRALERRIEDLKTENRYLGQELTHYRGDSYIEKIAREELGLVRPGDAAIIIVDVEGSGLALLPTPTPGPASGPVRRDTPPWQRWVALFVDRN